MFKPKGIDARPVMNPSPHTARNSSNQTGHVSRGDDEGIGRMTMELNEHLSRTADRIVAHGTLVETLPLHLMASAAQDLNPGAAAALVDWDGSEIARLRAFGIVHGVLLRELPAAAKSELLTHLLGTPSAIVLDPAPLVAQQVDSALITAGMLSVDSGV